MKYSTTYNDRENPGGDRLRILLWFTILLSLLAIYHLNRDVLPGNDAIANVYLSVSLLEEGNLSYEPLEFPFLFRDWRYETLKIKGQASQLKPDVTIDGITVKELVRREKVTYGNHNYALIPSITEGVYVNTFGIGSGIAMLPAALWLKLRTAAWHRDHGALWKAGKFTAALLVALSAAILFLCCNYFVKTGPAFLLAMAYGLGTGVWSISSQTLWQHGPNVFFLALGTYFFLKTEKKPFWALGSGAAFGYAVLCRPTSAIMVIAAGVYLLVVNRRGLRYYLAGGLPFLIILILYNYHYFGVMFDFGQIKVSGMIAEYKTGAPEIWQTSIFTGATGLLFAPSRGMLLYSPFLAGAIPGFFYIWGEKRWQVLRPLALGALGIFMLSTKWFDWWGGWCYGYRPVVDLAFFAVLLVTPVIGWLFAKRWRLTLFAGLIAWSVIVQFLGAFAYNLSGWNDPVAYKLILPGEKEKILRNGSKKSVMIQAREMGALKIGRLSLDVDLPENRNRLWSVADNQIFYYLTHYSQARRKKRALVKSWLKEPTL